MSDFFKDGSRWGSIDSSGSIYASDGTYLGSLDLSLIHISEPTRH